MDTTKMAALLTADLPKVQAFLGWSQVELAAKTNTDKAWWNRVLKGAGVNEATLNKLSEALEMQPHSLLFAISLRRAGSKIKVPTVELVA